MVKVKKMKKIEKAKVKLKEKRLPKGQNVTDTSFKARKIIMPGQLKARSEDEILTRRKLNIQELLSHLRHHNVSMRREGLSGLKELFTEYEEEIVKLHLPRILDSVSSLVLDIESELRKSALKLIETLLSKISPEQIAPHFDVLQTYLSCAMTHINISIREDSLLLLDSLLNVCPHLMVEKTDDVLPTFLNMISKLKNHSEHRTLSNELNSTMTSVRWRIRVFERLNKYFAAIVNARKYGNQYSKEMDVDTLEINSKIVKWSECSPLHAAEYMAFRKDICNLPTLFSTVKLTVENAAQSTLNQEKALKSHISSLMPILFEAWVEVAPLRGSADVGCIFEEPAVMLQYVLDTLQHIWDSIQSWEKEINMNTLSTWFRKEYQKIIISAFLPGFPFSLQENVFKPKVMPRKHFPKSKEKRTMEKNTISPTTKCAQQNLSLCYLLINIHNGEDNTVVQPVIKYLQNSVAIWDDPELVPILDKVLRLIIGSKSAWSKVNIVQTAVVKYRDLSVPIQLRQVLLSILCNSIEQFGWELRNRAVEKWISDLPYVFYQAEVPLETIKALRYLTSQNHEVFIRCLKRRSKDILYSLCEIPITGNSVPFEGQKMILDMMFHVIDSDSFDGLVKRIGDSEERKELITYVKNLKAFHEYMKSL